MSESENQSPSVKSMRHRKILDVAENSPEASMEEIAAEVPSATVDLVEHVLDKHGDPAANDSDSDEADSPADETEMNSIASLDELSAKERETLQVVNANPGATQGGIGEILDVSRATVSRRLNDIDGFEWNSRDGFVSRLFDGTSSPSDESETMSGEIDITERIAELDEQLSTIEDHVADCAGSATAGSVFTDPGLTHKIVHACLKADTISEEEELQILQELTSSPP